MHPESKDYMAKAFRTHAAGLAPGKVLDVGASGQGGYREIWESKGWTYHALELAPGPAVDVVLDDPWIFPLENDSYDAVISGQMLEHNAFFWLSFLEMARVLKMDGLMVHIAPSRGAPHKGPQDCWRFYRDGMVALAEWAGLECLDARTDWAPEHFEYYGKPRHARMRNEMLEGLRNWGTTWGDTVGVFKKTTPTRDASGMDYIRRFAAMNPAPDKTQG